MFVSDSVCVSSAEPSGIVVKLDELGCSCKQLKNGALEESDRVVTDEIRWALFRSMDVTVFVVQWVNGRSLVDDVVLSEDISKV